MRRGCLVLGLFAGLSVCAPVASAETAYRTWEITLQRAERDVVRGIKAYWVHPLWAFAVRCKRPPPAQGSEEAVCEASWQQHWSDTTTEATRAVIDVSYGQLYSPSRGEITTDYLFPEAVRASVGCVRLRGWRPCGGPVERYGIQSVCTIRHRSVRDCPAEPKNVPVSEQNEPYEMSVSTHP